MTAGPGDQERGAGASGPCRGLGQRPKTCAAAQPCKRCERPKAARNAAHSTCIVFPIRPHHSFRCPRKYRRSARCHAQPLYLLTPAGRFALRATAHRADASLRCAHGFAALANIGVLCAGRAQPLYLLTPSGRFGPLAQVPTGHTLPFGAPPGRFGPLAQQPTGLTLPSGAPKTCAAAQNASVASAQRAQETRHTPPSQKSHERPSASIKKNRPPPHKRERAATRPAGSIRQTDSPWDRAATRAGCRRCP